jgi:hypothetical protein
VKASRNYTNEMVWLNCQPSTKLQPLNQPNEQPKRNVKSQLVSQQLNITKYKTIIVFTYVTVHGKKSFLRSKLTFS